MSPDKGIPKDEQDKEGESPKPIEEAERTDEVSNIHVKAGVREVRVTLHSVGSGKLADVRVKGAPYAGWCHSHRLNSHSCDRAS